MTRCLDDELDHLRQRCLRADLGRFDAEGAVLIERPREDFVSDRFVGRNALAGQRTLIDSGGAIRDDAVNGNSLSGTNRYGIADANFLDG